MIGQTMIERVARSIVHRDEQGGGMPWEEMSLYLQELYMRSAVAAISAMREPTDTMLAAGAQAHESSPCHDIEGPLRHAWEAMIGVALEGK